MSNQAWLAVVDVEEGPTDEEIALAGMAGERGDFVIDLRDGQRVRSYLRPAGPSLVRSTQAVGSAPSRTARRAMDVAIALVGIFLASPALLLLFVLVKWASPGPVLFRQERVGLNGRIFTCLKFRSMYADAAERLESLLAEEDGFRSEWARDQKVKNDPRVTGVGRFLRKTSLDELPQLFNVIRGDMSIVGPRPVVPPETVRYGDAMVEVLSVRPGITGLWQVSGRNNLPYDERVALDRQYVRNRSLRADLIIVLRTAICLATGHGAS